jgi:hypothetical protein
MGDKNMNNNHNNRNNNTTSVGFRFLMVAIVITAWVATASAQLQLRPPGSTAAYTECGARIYSAQPFDGGQLCLYTSSTEDRARLLLRPCAQDESRREFLWRIVRRWDNGGFKISSVLNGDGYSRLMEVADFSKKDGATIQIWGPNFNDGYRSQTWEFFPVPGGNLIVNRESGRCLAVPLGRNRLDQEVPIQYECSREANFVWMVQSGLQYGERGCS